MTALTIMFRGFSEQKDHVLNLTLISLLCFRGNITMIFFTWQIQSRAEKAPIF